MADWRELNQDCDLAHRDFTASNARVFECYQLEHAARDKALAAGLQYQWVQRRGLILTRDGRNAETNELETQSVLHSAMALRYKAHLQHVVRADAKAACLSEGMMSEHGPG